MKWLVVVCAFSSSACAHAGSSETRSDTPLAQTDAKNWKCVEERQTGSLIAKEVCRPVDTIAADEADAKTEMELITRRSTLRMPRERPPSGPR